MTSYKILTGILSRTVSKLSLLFWTKTGQFAFLSSFEGLGTMYSVHFKLIGKLVVGSYSYQLNFFR